MNAKKQAIDDAHELFFLYDEFWKLYDETEKKSAANSKYGKLFRDVYVGLLQSGTNNPAEDSAVVQVVQKSHKLRNVVIIAGVAYVVHKNGYDKRALESLKKRYRRARLSLVPNDEGGE